MKVLFNVEPLLAPPLTGVGHYTRHILDGLLDLGVEVVCVAGGRVVPLPGAAVEAPSWLPPPPSLGRTLRRAVGAVPGTRQTRAAWFEWKASRAVRTLGADVYHDPNHMLRPMGCPSVVTMHDLSILHYPQFHPPERVRAMGAAIRSAAHRAERIITGAAFIKRDVMATLGVAAERIRVVPYGVGPEFRPLDAAAMAPVLREYGLQAGGYVLAVGTREPRKNLERLIEAFLALPERVRAARPLALVGPAGWQATRIEARLDAAERDGTVRRLGYIPDAHRVPLYAGAACFAYPSLYEGFGLPPLEAAACGVPVLTSRDSPMEEVLGEAATLVDPLDVAAITAGLRAILDDPGAPVAARIAGPARAAAFSWGASVAGTLAVYRELVPSPSPLGRGPG